MNQPPSLESRLAARERPQDQRLAMRQNWRDLLFLHWTYDPEEVQETLPPGLTADTFDSRAYIGLVPFFMKDVRPWFLPAVRGISNFQELNLRTYVYDEQGLPGVWFYSLDANQRLAVATARRLYALPYIFAEMESSREQGGWIRYTSRREGTTAEMRSSFRYRRADPERRATPDSLDFFLVERYVLFSYAPKMGKLRSGRVHHPPYPIFEAEVSEWDDRLFELDGLKRPGRAPDHILGSPGVDVEVFALS